MTRQAGFTLIELLIVIAVIGILVAAGGLGVRGLLDRSRLNDALTTLESQVAEARRLSKRLDRDVTFAVFLEGNAWKVSVDDAVRTLPGAVTVATGSMSIDLQAPYGTYAGPDRTVRLGVGNVGATATITGVLAKTVVQR